MGVERGGWITWALVATLIGSVVAANGFQLATAMVQGFLDQSTPTPPDPSWTYPLSPILIGVAALLMSGAAWAMGYGWAKVRAKSVEKRKRRQVLDEPEEQEEDRFALPPGFGERRVKTKRHGLAPLLGFTVLSLVLFAAAGALLVAGILTLIQTTGMDGTGYQSAITFGRLTRFGGLPMATLAGLVLGIAWGRWFPLGELEIIEEKVARERAVQGATWNREL